MYATASAPKAARNQIGSTERSRVATGSKPATQVTAKSVPSAMAVLAATNTSDSARVRSMWDLRAKAERVIRIERARECTSDGYRHLRSHRERQIEGCGGGGGAAAGRACVCRCDAGLPGPPDPDQPG